MIHIATPPDRLRASERFGLSVLLDLSRLLPVLDANADVVRLVIPDAPSRDDFASFLDGRWTFECSDGEVRCSRETLGYVADVAGAGVEQRSTARDRYERIPAEASPLGPGHRSRAPIINRCAEALRQAVIAAAGRRPVRLLAPWPDGSRWAAAFTHDLDIVAGWPAFTGLRLLELARAGELARAARVAGAALLAAAGDPVGDGVAEVLETELAHGVRSTWFILCGTPTFATWRAGDLTYSPESPAARRLLDRIGGAGHEIGLHGSFATMTDAERFHAERDRLAGLIGRAPWGVRQHFLRMRPGPTQRAMVAAGFTYDATFGFSDRTGFRLGAADVVPGFDADSGAPSGLEEVPLVWMDRALSKHLGVEDPDEWVKDALTLAETCRGVDGLWVGLWHPNLTPALGFPGAPEAFRHLVAAIAALRPWIAPLGQIAAWRATRRIVRAHTVGAGGKVELFPPPTSQAPIRLEDAQGRAVDD